jgi:8-oxo-dGTP pyrophosphatase MutT (NUDIX family)
MPAGTVRVRGTSTFAGGRCCVRLAVRYSEVVSPFMDRLAQRLAAPAPAGNAAAQRRAAVAAVLHDEPAGPRVLLMKRVERTGDPWSGHISLPGGGYQASDASLLETAIRETREELGIELAGARVLGGLAPLHPRSSGPLGIEVTPFVFALDAAPEPVCGPEALSAFWLPLALAASGSLDAMYTYPTTQMEFPSWQYDGHVIWGLTWRILGDLLAAGREA